MTSPDTEPKPRSSQPVVVVAASERVAASSRAVIGVWRVSFCLHIVGLLGGLGTGWSLFGGRLC